MPPSSDNLELGPCNVYLEESAVDVNVGYLGNVTLNLGSEAAPLTASQRGTSPVDKVLTGGSVQLTIEFKELTLQNFARAFPHAVLTGDNGRVDFTNRVGLSLRSLAKKLTLKKIVGGVESALAKDILVIPEASPVEGELSVEFNAETQRVLAATFEAWPNDTTGRWGYFGDELAS
ncbi:MAG: hypothetical protein ACE147_00650 [Candidatus Methylomirabilales bacterium]